MSVPIGGGTARKVVDGSSPAVSPNGRYLAYTAKGTRPGCDRRAFVVRDLTNGRERRWSWAARNPDDPNPPSQVLHTSWAPDNRHLAFVINEGDPKFVTYLFDRAAGSTILDGKRVGGRNDGWYEPEFIDIGTLALIHGIESIHDGDRQRVISVTTAGKVRSQLAGRHGEINDIALDASRTFLVYASVDGIYRVQNGSATRIARGSYGSVDW